MAQAADARLSRAEVLRRRLVAQSATDGDASPTPRGPSARTVRAQQPNPICPDFHVAANAPYASSNERPTAVDAQGAYGAQLTLPCCHVFLGVTTNSFELSTSNDKRRKPAAFGGSYARASALLRRAGLAQHAQRERALHMDA